ncbi:MAG: serine/threonine protein kinase bacterial, partial [bacterium]
SDIYSLGVIAYEMIAGRRPFIGKGFEIAIQHIFEAPLPPSHFNPELPKMVDEAILSALNKDPKDRPSSAREFAASFGAYLNEQKRKRASVSRIVFVATIIVLVLGVSAIVNNWYWFENNWQSVKVVFGWVEQNKSYRSYSKLKLVWPSSGKEVVLATSNPVKASMLTIQQFIARFSSDGSLVAIYQQPVQTPFNQQSNLRNQESQSQKVELWNTFENKKIHQINLEKFDPICDLRFSQDSKLLAISGLNEVRIIDISNSSQLYSLTTLENNDYIRFLSSKENLLVVASVRRPQVKVGVSITYPIEKQSSVVSLWHLSKNQKPTEIVNQYGKIEFIETIPSENGFLGLIQWHISKKEPKRRIELWGLTDKASLKNQWDVIGDGGAAITADGSKIALHLSPSRIVEFSPSSGEEIKEYSYSLNPKLKTAYLFYDKDNNLVIATPERLENLTQGKLIYKPPSNSFFVDFTPATEALLVESVITEVNK